MNRVLALITVVALAAMATVLFRIVDDHVPHRVWGGQVWGQP